MSWTLSPSFQHASKLTSPCLDFSLVCFCTHLFLWLPVPFVHEAFSPSVNAPQCDDHLLTDVTLHPWMLFMIRCTSCVVVACLLANMLYMFCLMAKSAISGYGENISVTTMILKKKKNKSIVSIQVYCTDNVCRFVNQIMN